MKFDYLMDIRKGVCMLSCFSCVQLFVTLWTCLLQGIFPTQGLNLCLLCSLHSETMSWVKFSCSVVFDYLRPHDCTRVPGLPVHHQLPEFIQTHDHWVSDAIQPSHPLSSPSPPTVNLSQHQGLFQWVSSSHQVAKVLEFHLQHQLFQWIVRTDFL